MHFGVDPILMLTSGDPILARVLDDVVTAAQAERAHERDALAAAIGNAVNKVMGG